MSSAQVARTLLVAAAVGALLYVASPAIPAAATIQVAVREWWRLRRAPAVT